MGMMLKYGSESAKKFYLNDLIKPEYAQAHQNGDIHIHDLDFYALTMTCCQIDLIKLFKGGFQLVMAIFVNLMTFAPMHHLHVLLFKLIKMTNMVDKVFLILITQWH